MSLKRIAILSVHTSPLASLGGKKTGGMNVYVREFSQELAEHGISVDIYTRRYDTDSPEIDTSLGENVRVIYLPAGPATVLDPNDMFPYLSEFTAKLIAFTTRRGIHYDLIYSHYWLSGWVANKLKEVWNTPFVHMFHTLGHMKNRIDSQTEISLPDTRITVETQIVKWADRIIAATPAEYAQLLWLYRADRRKIVIAPPGVDPDRFYPISHIEAKRQLGIEGECDLLLFVGRIEPLKAVDMVIEAIGLLKAQNPLIVDHLCFAIIGGDPQNPAERELFRLKKLTLDLGLTDVVSFLGAKNHEMLPVYYAAATAVVMPSDYESFGMVALEAMSSGTPVIASEVGGLAFLVKDDETGFLVPTRDAHALASRISILLENPAKREQLGKNAAALAKQYTWSNIVERLLPEFDKIVCPKEVQV